MLDVAASKFHQFLSKHFDMSKPAKKFVLKHTFENVSQMKEAGRIYSEEEEHFNVPWRMFIIRENGHLSIFLNCWKPLDGAKWSIQTDFELKLATGGQKMSVGHIFGNKDGNTKYSSRGFPKFMNWEEMKKMHLIGDKLIVEAHVSIVNMTGFYAEKSMVFDDQNMKNLSDTQLIVGSKSFFISKQFLSSQSSYFKELFTVSHKNEKIITFSWLNAADFQKYLETLYGQSGVIDEANVEGVLLIATQLSTPSVFSKCVDFLVEKSKKSMEKKLQMANRYGSDRLRNHCAHISQHVPTSPSAPFDSTYSLVYPQIVEPKTVNNVTSNNIETINDVIEYRSPMAAVDTASGVLNVSDQCGLKCTWSGNLLHEKGPIDFTWRFDWDELKQKGIDSFTGHIIGKLTNSEGSYYIDVDLKNPTQMVEHVISNDQKEVHATFEYYLIPIFDRAVEKTQETKTTDLIVIEKSEEEDVKSDSIVDVLLEDVVISEDMFLPTKKNDTILVVEAKLLYVNKAYLSYHSDYFEHLFTDNEKEQFEIEDVTYEDFSLLMRAIYPESVFPSENLFPKLAALADRFQMPTVTRQIENLVLKGCQLEHPIVMGMADKYGMPRLLEKSIHSTDSAEKAKNLKTSPEFVHLSLETKARLFERVVDFI